MEDYQLLANWKLDVKKIIDIEPSSFYPKPKIEQLFIIFFT